MGRLPDHHHQKAIRGFNRRSQNLHFARSRMTICRCMCRCRQLSTSSSSWPSSRIPQGFKSQLAQLVNGRAPVGLDDPVHDRQSQTGPLARLFSRKIGFEN